ncbi:MAG: Gfo/Idh/MocA family oxidoreductase [Nitrososphaerota archaeon]
MLRIGLVGCGVIANAHLNAYSLMGDVEVVALCDAVESSAVRAARQYGVARVYLDYDDFLKKCEMDIVDICVPTQFHRDFIVKALEAGKHVFCEKPLAANLREADEVIDAQKSSDRLVFIGQSNRYLPIALKAKQIQREGGLGDVILVRAAHRFDNPLERWAESPDQSKYHWEKGGGPIIDSGVHCADLCNWFSGGRPASVTADGIRQPRALPFFTSAHIHIEYENGVHGIVIVNRQTRGYPQYERYLEVIGSSRRVWGFDNFYRQSIIPNSLSLRSLFPAKNGPKEKPTAHRQFVEYLPALSEIYAELLDFVKALSSGRPPPIRLEEARSALEICVAAEKSVREGREVELPLGGEG